MGRALRCRTPGSHQGLAHRGASAGGPRLSAPTEPRLPQCALPVGVQDQSQPAPVRPRCSQEAVILRDGHEGAAQPAQAAPAPGKHALSQEGGSAEAPPDAQACSPARPSSARAHTCPHTHSAHTHWLLGSTRLRPPRMPVWNYSPPHECVGRGFQLSCNL